MHWVAVETDRYVIDEGALQWNMNGALHSRCPSRWLKWWGIVELDQNKDYQGLFFMGK